MAGLNLPRVTLVAVDTRAPQLAAQALRRSLQHASFARSLLFMHGEPAFDVPAGVDIVAIEPIRSGAEYSRFVLQRLHEWIETPHVLVSQWDGFVVEPSAWNDAWLDYDYIGAPWAKAGDLAVGNGGFSLRSRRLLQASRDPRIVELHPEDMALCRTYRELLVREHGVRFAPLALARGFACENVVPDERTFGFHGPRLLPRFLDEATLAAWIDVLPDAFFSGRDARRLARALLVSRMPGLARRVVERRVRVGRGEPSTRLLGAAAAILELARAGKGGGR